jgi:hypothetical protein
LRTRFQPQQLLELRKMLISPMPSPAGSNREQLYILRGGARRGLTGGAYDETPNDRDPVAEIVQWVSANLSPEDQTRLMEQLAETPARAMDDDGAARPAFDPTQTRTTAPGQALAQSRAMDSMIARSLEKRFPGIGKIDVAPTEHAARKAVATDSARLRSLGERFPGFDRIGFA